MRVLQVLWDGGGNTAPQLAIARTLVDRGHDVAVLTHRCQQAKVEATGARFTPYRHAPEGDASSPETDIARDWEAKTPIGAFARIRDRLMYGPSAEFARDVLDTLDSQPADVVVWDYLLLGAGLGAERAGVPSATVIHTVYPLPAKGVPPFGLGLQPARGILGRMRDAGLTTAFKQAFKPGLKALNAARSDLGLAPLDDPFGQVSSVDSLLVMTSPALDYAGSAALPANVSYAGAELGVPGPAGWESPWPEDDPRPLVLASFSTTFMNQRGLIARTVAALSELPVRALVTTGPAVDTAKLHAPANVVIEEFVPHAAVLPETDLVVTHAGMGTVHAALAAGVPLVCMPAGRDQPDVAARVQFHGVGLRIGQSAGRRRLRRAISRALADDSLATAARRMSEALDVDGAARAADEIERLAGAERSPPAD